MKIYTRTGDDGTTSLYGGARVNKTHPRVAAYGTVDELNAYIGLARCECTRLINADDESRPFITDLEQVLAHSQSILFDIGAALATPDDATEATRSHVREIADEDIKTIEHAIDRFDDALPDLKNFVLPGGTELAARLHVARTICRRAEREVVALGTADSHDANAVIYLNRVSDMLFVFARFANHACGVDDVPWISSST